MNLTTYNRTVQASEYYRFVYDILIAAGSAEDDAKTVAEILLWSDLHGRNTNGLVRLPILVERLSKGLIHSPADMTWISGTSSVSILNADNGFGQVAGRLAMERAIDFSRTQGIGFVVVRHSNHYGAAAYYCSLAAEAGCLGMTCTNAFPKVAAYGGKSPVLGTNPLAFGCPTDNGVPILVDLSTSAISGAEVRAKAGGGTNKLPPGVALDANGNPTDDSATANKGCLLPAAGPKGFGLAIMVEILSGVLSGAAIGKQVGSLFHTWDRPINVGHSFIAIDIDHFMERKEFVAKVNMLLEWIKGSQAMDPDEPIRYPGEVRGKYAEEYSREGIPLDAQAIKIVTTLAEKFGVKGIS